MSVENPQSRVVVLNNWPDYYQPKARCLMLGPVVTTNEALVQAKNLERNVEIAKGLIFIEDPRKPATRRDMDCGACNTRRPNAFDPSLIFNYLLG